MNKLLLAISGLILLAGSAFADSTNVGVKLSYGNFDAAGSHTTNRGGVGSTAIAFVDGKTGGPAVNASGDATFPFASIFIEREKEFSKGNIAVGLDYIPLSAEIDSIPGGNAADGTGATVEVGNQMTLYIQPSKELSNGVKVFGKLGYSRMDLDITGLKRQAVTNVGAGATSTTDTSASKDLDGIMIGLGFEKSMSVGPLDFVRLEATFTDYEKVSHTNSNGKVLSADADLTAINLSVGKRF
jgi:hypothetical protein